MDATLPMPGSYVVAVSGGVDSMSLLHALHQANMAADRPWQLIVAHLDHGIREDSVKDRQLVQATARRYGLPFTYREARLGAGTNEAEARTIRYDFLHQVQWAGRARAIVTAHHQDDVLETAILNVLRGTGRKGLTSLRSRHNLERPLLEIPKHELMAYARDQGLQWREDSTNQNTDYLRNYVRHRLVPRFNESDRTHLLRIINDLRQTNQELDTLLVNQLHLQADAGKLDRQWFNRLPHAVARETMATWLRAYGVRAFDSRTLERLVVAAKVAGPGKAFDVLDGVSMAVGTNNLALSRPER
jgi:tRNA(Ile)-lysidine synthase